MTYAAYDSLIWGTGDDPCAARLDARRWFDPTLGDEARTQRSAALQVAPMTLRLQIAVREHGGHQPFNLRDDGVLDLSHPTTGDIGHSTAQQRL